MSEEKLVYSTPNVRVYQCAIPNDYVFRTPKGTLLESWGPGYSLAEVVDRAELMSKRIRARKARE